ncbi:histidine phosphatase family protein [Echinicola strongylocentroti]|uniref:Histidine phosphatase family protein n=1 Tax=Echinicola strongylocentroti TaxID=1795355 RepID=A0A2Z4IKW5_9BACT|nr:histidine phosphatase family protein [Echinicola strongylocentroti]AWW31752.1 histidine phosphatase family protein [Echinicola strongylocentroti]
MSTKKIYLVRHGQTDYNLRGVVQGSGINASINATGRKQAEAFYEAYRHIKFDRIYYTGLKRTRQSIERFLDNGTPYESLPDLNEISWGKYEGVPMTKDEHSYYQGMLEKWSDGDLDFSIEGGESPNMVFARLKRGLEYILSQEGETILICMHGRAMRIMLSLMLDYDLRFMDVFDHHNLGYYELTVKEDGKFILDRYNHVKHLKIKGLIG